MEEEKPAEQNQPKPLTAEEFKQALDQLTERAKAAGLRPLQTMAATYLKQSMDVLDGLLAALEGAKDAKPEQPKQKQK